MAIRVTRRARRHPDRAGDPLDGLVNLFDVGIVLAVGFLLAGMAIARGPAPAPRDVVAVRRETQVRDAQLSGRRVVGEGRRIGSVYQLSDGRTIVVRGDEPSAAGGARSGDTGAEEATPGDAGAGSASPEGTPPGATSPDGEPGPGG